MRNEVKPVKSYEDALCCNCIHYNNGKCCVDLPILDVESNDRCTNRGEWLCEDKLYNLRGVCLSLKTHPIVNQVSDLVCENCISFYKSTSTCHFKRMACYEVLSDDFCGDGCWLYLSTMGDGKEEIVLGGPEYLYEAISCEKK